LVSYVDMDCCETLRPFGVEQTVARVLTHTQELNKQKWLALHVDVCVSGLGKKIGQSGVNWGWDSINHSCPQPCCLTRDTSRRLYESRLLPVWHLEFQAPTGGVARNMNA